jgi:hypothetical protein
MKQIDPHLTIFEITAQHSELIEILAELGFLGVKNPILRKTLGKKTSLLEGCKRQGKSIEEVRKKLQERGFNLL